MRNPSPLPRSQPAIDAPPPRPTSGGGLTRRALLQGAAVVGGAALATPLGETRTPSAALAQRVAPLVATRFVLTVLGAGPVEELEYLALEELVSEVGKPPRVTLRRRATESTSLATWHELARSPAALANPSLAWKDGELVAYTAESRPVLRYRLEDATPTLLELRGQRSGEATELFETVTLSCMVLDRLRPEPDRVA